MNTNIQFYCLLLWCCPTFSSGRETFIVSYSQPKRAPQLIEHHLYYPLPLTLPCITQIRIIASSPSAFTPYPPSLFKQSEQLQYQQADSLCITISWCITWTPIESKLLELPCQQFCPFLPQWDICDFF